MYPSIHEALRRARPQDNADMFSQSVRESWPQDNERAEAELRSALAKLADAPPADAAERIAQLEKEHGERRAWVWSKLGRSPLAGALHALDRLRAAVTTPLVGSTPAQLAESYVTGGWKADDAALGALDAARAVEDASAVRAAVRALYASWLEQGALRLQKLVQASSLPVFATSPTPEPPAAGTVILFADGLRYDVGERLRSKMSGKGWNVNASWRWSALPSVTPTAKPAVSPVADMLAAEYVASDFCPNVADSGKPLTADRFRSLLDERGIQFLRGAETGDPGGAAWTEIGDLDSYGHKQEWKLAWRVNEVVNDIVARVEQLLSAGWRSVRIVTDHGWLLLPGGLPKEELPSFLAETRWGRCAALKGSALVNFPMVPWYWRADVMVAVAPGIGAFIKGAEYAHGGVTVQECVTPSFVVSLGGQAAATVSIAAVKWVGLRCRVTLAGDFAGCQVDLRTQVAKAASSVASKKQPKPADERGTASLAVEDDDMVGSAAVVVVLNAAGEVIAKRATTVGES